MTDSAQITTDHLPSTWVVGHDIIPEEIKEDKQRCQETRKLGLTEWLSTVNSDENGNDDFESTNDCNPDLTDGLRLAIAAQICEEMRAAVLEQTGFKCSAGISHSKVLSKLACGLHKPNQQTILPQSKVTSLWEKTPIRKVRNLGGKLGESLTEDFECGTMGDLAKLSLPLLQSKFDGKTAGWLYDIGRGFDHEKVIARQLPKSIGCGKNFTNRDLNTKEKVMFWLTQLSEELAERIEEDQTANKRRAKTITFGVRLGDEKYTTLTRSSSLSSCNAHDIAKLGMSLIQHTNKAGSKNNNWTPPILNLSLSVGKFEDNLSCGSASIQELFNKVIKRTPKKTNPEDAVTPNKDVDTQPRQISRPSTSRFELFFKQESEKPNNEITKKIDKNIVNDEIKQDKNEHTTNSFFRRFLMKKDEEAKMELERNTKLISHCNDNNDVERIDGDNENHNSDGSENGDDLDELVSQLSDDSRQSFQNDIMTENSHSSIISNENTNPIVDKTSNDSHSDTKSSELNHKRNLIFEMFPNINDMEESILTCLPPDLQEVARNIQVEFAAKRVGKNALKKTGIWKYSKELQSTNFSENLSQNVDYNSDSDNSSSAALAREIGMKALLNSKNDCTLPNIHNNSLLSNKSNENIERNSIEYSKDIYNNTDDLVDCSECGNKISAFEMVEHLDYHLAVQLRQEQRNEIQQNGSTSSSKTNTNVVQSNNRKRGRKSKINMDNSNAKVTKLDSYFKRTK